MISDLTNFDPIEFLEINKSTCSQEEIDKMRSDLNTKIGEYILLKLSNNLSDEQLTELAPKKDGLELLNTLRQFIPDFDTKMNQEIEKFKVDYQNALKGENNK